MEYIASQITAQIEEETTNLKIDNAHGITMENLPRHLTEPIIEKYIDSIDVNLAIELWTVLEELPETKDGYCIYYDPEKNAFGLGMRNNQGQKIALGIYGSFIDTLNAM